MSCPACGDAVAWTRCWECGWEDGATADVPPSRRPEPQRRSVRIVIPWDFLASDNLRKGLDRAKWADYKRARDASHACALGQVRGVPAYPDGDVAVIVVFTPPDRRRRDPNNLTKCLCDALAGVAYADDAQIAEMSWTRTEPGEDARAVVTVLPRKEAHVA